jgi:uncharacterized protein YjiS (DUF1127 family)
LAQMAARSDKLCRVHRRRPATTRHIAQALLMTCLRCVVVARMSVRRRQMSKQFRDAPRVFVRYHGFKFPHPNDRTRVECEGQKLEQNRDGPFGHLASSVLLRDDHIVLAAIDALLALHASFKNWRNRRRTLRALADLDDRQLRDIGLTRDDGDSYRPLAGVDDAIGARL